MKIHELKCWPDPFEALSAFRKTHEFRKDDRTYEVGDVLILRRWNPETGVYTGHEPLARRIAYLQRGPDFGVPDGFVVMSVVPLK